MPQITRPQVRRVVGEMLPKREWTKEELICRLHDMQERNERLTRSHIKRRLLRTAIQLTLLSLDPSL